MSLFENSLFSPCPHLFIKEISPDGEIKICMRVKASIKNQNRQKYTSLTVLMSDITIVNQRLLRKEQFPFYKARLKASEEYRRAILHNRESQSRFVKVLTLVHKFFVYTHLFVPLYELTSSEVDLQLKEVRLL